MESIEFKLSDRIPVTAKTEVLVVGGGPGGLGAAVMSARCGAKTLLVEQHGRMGGTAAFATITPFMPSHQFTEEGKPPVCLDRPVYPELGRAMNKYLPERLRWKAKDDNMWEHASRVIMPDIIALAAEDLCREAGVSLLYHHTLVGVVKEGRKIKYAVFFAESGFSAIEAETFIDSTGDGDLAAFAGCEFEYGDKEHGLCQPMTLCFKLSHVDRKRVPWEKIQQMYLDAKAEGKIHCPRENILHFYDYNDDVVHFNTTRVVGKSAIVGAELSEADIEARDQVRELVAWFRKEVRGFEDAEIVNMGAQIGVRESRRVLGKAFITRDDFKNCTKFPDAITRSNYGIDIHSVTGAGTERTYMDKTQFYEIPFGSIIPKDVDNLAIGARCISADHAIHSSLRIMPTVISLGQAAGAAAALATAKKTDVSGLDGRDVRALLVEKGAFLK